MTERRRSISVAVYRLLLFCYPSGFRDEFGDQLTLVFRDQHRTARHTHGWRGVLTLWVGVLADLLLVAHMEHISLLMQDIRVAVRTFRKSPGFAAIAIGTMALGIGAATAIFSVVNGVLIKPVPFRDPDRLALVYLNDAKRSAPRRHFSLADYVDWRAHDRAFDEAAAFGGFGRLFTVNGLGEPGQVRGVYATGSFFSILGVKAIAGDLFKPGDDEAGRVRTVVLSENLWRRRGADPRIVGSLISINGEPHIVSGVAPSSFRYPFRDVDVWTILRLDTPVRRGPYYLRGIGRLKAGVDSDQAAAQLRAVPLGIRAGAGPEQKALTFTVVPLREEMVGEVRPMLWLLLASVGLLLLIAVTNVASLQIARSAARMREFATRLSIGATRLQLARQQLTESLLLSLTGGAAGVILAFATVRLLRWAAPANLPRVDEVTVDPTVLLFAVVVSILAGVLFGLAPALRATPNLVNWLSQGGRNGSQGRDHGRLRMGLAAAQIALSCVLLIGAGLLIRSFMALQDVSTGIRSEQLLLGQVSLSGERYRDDTAARTFYRELLDGVSAIPGVEAASLSSTVPPGQGGFSENITIEGSGQTDSPIVLLPIVQADYFRAMGIPLTAGRYFTAADTAESPRVTVISETMARRYYPDQNAVGRRLKIGGRERPDAPWLEVVGVVGDVRYRGLDAKVEPVFYVPHTQNTMRSMYLVLRTSLPPSSLRTAAGQQVAALDNRIPLPEFHRVDDLLYESVAQPRFRTLLVAGFALVALAIAGVGLYGVMAYGVARRVREIGIRIALGAQSGTVLSMILREAGLLAIIGIVTGIAGALALQKLVSGFLFGIAATDVPTFGGVVAVLAGTCLLASYIPARRAARVDPLISLKAE